MRHHSSLLCALHTLFLFTFLSLNLDGQSQNCLTSGALPEYMVVVPITPRALLDHKLVKIYFHVYRDDNGEGGETQESLDIVFEDLNTYFEGSKISFFYNPCETNWVDSTVLFNSAQICDFYNNFNHVDGIDIHVRHYDCPNIASANTKTIPSDEFIIGGKFSINTIGDSQLFSSTLAHEMGHALGLHHTFGTNCTDLTTQTLCAGITLQHPTPEQGDFVEDTNIDDVGDIIKGLVGDWKCEYDINSPACIVGDIAQPHIPSVDSLIESMPMVDNFMSYYWHKCLNRFTDGQICRMHELMFSEIIHENPNGCCGEGLNTYFDEGEHSYTVSTDIPASIVIESGATLTINAMLKFGEGKGIFVKRGGKLFIDTDGVLTNCGAEKWKGIVVEGAPKLQGQLNSPDEVSDSTYSGTVVLQNAGIIENAMIGISTINDTLPQNLQAKYFGGLIIGDQGIIRDCDKGIVISTYGVPNSLDQSHFNNIQFSNLTFGVEIDASDGVEFTQCTFDNIQESAIKAINSAVNVYDGNTFSNVKTGVDLVATQVNQLSSVIGQLGYPANNFLSGQYGVYSTKVNNLVATSITNNNFSTIHGVYADGPSQIECDFNSFENCETGFYAIDTDDYDNFARNNEFLDNTVAIRARHNNQSLIFSNNCMDGTLEKDIWIQGTIAEPGQVKQQGNELTPAGNCYSKAGIPELLTKGVSLSFDYYVSSDELIQGSCFNPEIMGTFSIEQSANTNPEDCGSTGFAGDPPSGSPCGNGTDATQILANIETLDAELALLKSSGGSLSSINSTSRCLKNTLLSLAKIYAENENFIASNVFFATRPEYDLRLIPYSNYLQQSAYTDARQYLNSLQTSTQRQVEHKATQYIYLDYLQDENFVLTAGDSLILVQTGALEGPLNGHARAVYYVITGERIEVPLPPEDRSAANKPKEIKTNAKPVTIYPNPLHSNILNIEGIENLSQVKLEIRDLQGVLTYFKQLANGEKFVGMNNLPSGVYFVRVRAANDIILQEKLILFR